MHKCVSFSAYVFLNLPFISILAIIQIKACKAQFFQDPLNSKSFTCVDKRVKKTVPADGGPDMSRLPSCAVSQLIIVTKRKLIFLICGRKSMVQRTFSHFKSIYRCHLHQRVEEHKHSVIGKHFWGAHGLTPTNLIKNFKVLIKCRSKLDCLIHEMLWIKNKGPKLNTQTDSIRAKLFT